MRKIIVIAFALFLSSNAFAQLEVKEGSFKEVTGFVNVNTEKLTDDNDQPYAVLKIRTENIDAKQRQELSFKGDARTFFAIEHKDGEVWVYLSYYATYIKISHPDLSSTEFRFPFEMEPKKGYELTIINIPPVNEDLLNRIQNLESIINETKTTTTQYQIGYITVKSTPNGADVFIDNVKVGTTPYLAESINIGNHKISVALEGFEPDARRIEIEANKEYKVEFTLNKDNEEQITNSRNTLVDNTRTNLLNGKFSISSKKQVRFSQGNLQYQASTKSLRFANNQWDTIGYNNKYYSPVYNGWIDLFRWGSGKDLLGYVFRTFNDWGNNTIINGAGLKWRTLTKKEWVYIFDKRKTTSGIRYARANVNGINGIILLPDTWDNQLYSLNLYNLKYVDYDSNIISKDDWLNIFELNGAVFLPAAGCRFEIDVFNVNQEGSYWSSTYFGIGYAYYVYFYEKILTPNSFNYGRGYCYSVRLVSVLK